MPSGPEADSKRHGSVRQAGASVLALLLAVLWLLALGAGAQFQGSLAFAVLLLVLGTFWLTHVHRECPRGWHFNRLGRPMKRWLLWGALLAAILCAWRVLLALQFDSSRASAEHTASQWTLFAAVFAAPIIEEFGFRLWLQSHLERWLPVTAALLLASGLFAVVHDLDRWYLHFSSGLLFGLGLWLSGSIWVPVLMHGTSNALLAGLQSLPSTNRWTTAIAQSQPHWLDEATLGLSALLLLGIGAGLLLRCRAGTRAPP